MENLNNNPITPEVAEEAPVVVETPAVEPAVVEAPAVVEEAPVEVKEEAAEAVEEAKPESPVINAPRYPFNQREQALGSVAGGAIGATTALRTSKEKVAKTSSPKETVALYSTKNVTWSGVGKVYRGYNIVDKEASEKWLTRSHIRIATPEEVAKEFGK